MICSYFVISGKKLIYTVINKYHIGIGLRETPNIVKKIKKFKKLLIYLGVFNDGESDVRFDVSSLYDTSNLTSESVVIRRHDL